MRRSPAIALLSALVLMLGVVACGAGEDSTSSSTAAGRGSESGGGGHDDHSESSPVAEGSRTIEVSATSFGFEPDQIEVAAGEDVAIVLSSDDILHDFAVEGLDVHVAAEQGETAEGGLRADEPGEYTYYCTIAGHREAGMEGTLIVEAS